MARFGGRGQKSQVANNSDLNEADVLKFWQDQCDKIGVPYDIAWERNVFVEWLSHWASMEFSIFNVQKMTPALQVILAQQARIYSSIRASGFTEAQALKMLDASKALAANRSKEESRQKPGGNVSEKQKISVRGRGSSGRAAHRAKKIKADRQSNGDWVTSSDEKVVTPISRVEKYSRLRELAEKLKKG